MNTLSYEKYFPRGIALGKAFCNRENERSRLSKNMLSGQHTLLMSPRRYGKTSLVKFAINETSITNGDADLFVAVDAKKIEQKILHGIQKIINSLSSTLEQTIGLVNEYFKKASATWKFGTDGVSVTLQSSDESDAATNIMEALLALENILQKKKKYAVLFIDEIQEIGELAEGKGIEGAIRHVAQQSRNLALVFSGSKRHLLVKMFGDSSRPLYKLCDRIIIERIDVLDYQKHINKFTAERWGRKIKIEMLQPIFECTELHPYYINSLCLRIWDSNLKQFPSGNIINEKWLQLVAEERFEVLSELTTLSKVQRKILFEIAKGNNKKLSAKRFLMRTNLSQSSIADAVKILEQRDYIEKLSSKEYRIVDPLIKTALLVFSE